MIQIQQLEKSFAGQLLFENASLQLSPKERLGIVGRNGSGKSTLFKMILGTERPDKGSVEIPKNYTIASLDQYIEFSHPTVLEECLPSLKDEESFNHYKVEKILSGLGFEDEDMHKDPKSFSGGYQIRINLCKALVQEPNLLLLDEPTNYLDIVSLSWLKTFLKQFPGEVIIITHDRDFMDSVCTHIMGIYRQRIKKVKGNTLKFYEQLAEEEEIHEKTRLNQEKKRAHLQSFVDRFKAKATKAKQAQSRMKMLDKMDQIDVLENEANLHFSFNFQQCPAKVIKTVENISFNYQNDPHGKCLFSNLSFAIEKNDRIGIIGKNGKGKSTLLNVISGEITALQGEIKNHPSIKTGFFGQTNVDRLHQSHTIAQEILTANSDLSHTGVRNICGTMMFPGDLADKKISVLSGGEKSRVLLGKILVSPTNLLLLDEPTNHLDMESVQSLTEAIDHYPGAIMMVTHNEHMLKNLVNKLIIFHQGKAELFLGNYNDFLEKIGWEEQFITKKEKKISKLSKKELKHQRALIIQARSKVCGPLKKTIEKLEEQIMSLEQDLEEQNKLLEQATTAQSNDEVIKISGSIGQLHIKIHGLFEQLESESELYEKEKQVFDKQLTELE